MNFLGVNKILKSLILLESLDSSQGYSTARACVGLLEPWLYAMFMKLMLARQFKSSSLFLLANRAFLFNLNFLKTFYFLLLNCYFLFILISNQYQTIKGPTHTVCD